MAAEEPKYSVRRWRQRDIPAIVACQRAAYPDYHVDAHYDERAYKHQLQAFPQGQFLVECAGEVVAYATSLIVQLDESAPHYRYSELTGGGTFSTHDHGGDTLYGADIAVHPAHRGRGVAALLYEQRAKLLRRFNLRRMVAYGRIPGYVDHQGKITAEEYVRRVQANEISDPALSAHLKAGYAVLGLQLDFFSDPSSVNYSTKLEMRNERYDPAKRQIAASPVQGTLRKMRVCAAQYLMRRIQSWEELEASVEFFVDVADTYHCHFLLFPELFTAQLMSSMPAGTGSRAAIEGLAKYHDRYVEMFKAKARAHNLYIIGGSHPVKRDGGMFNVAHLFTPTGSVYTQDKLHITPSEREYWGIQPGDVLRLFDTPFGRISIQICYDIEFPELGRIAAFAGAEVIFVPFSTDDRQAYYRVRYTSHARAVENYVYVVLAGNVGNLPSREYLLNYARTAVLTPCDVGFAALGVAAEADPNVETVTMADLDLNSLAHQRELGSVRPFYDLRPDIYHLEARAKIDIVRTE